MQQRTASRRTALTLTFGLGLTGTVLATIWLAVDQATTNSVGAHVTDMYSPHGAVPDPLVPWLFLYGIFGAGIICWATGLLASVRAAPWTRGFTSGVFLLGTAILAFAFLVSEYGQPILPTSWRITSLSIAAWGAIVMLIAWLPTTDRIRT